MIEIAYSREKGILKNMTQEVQETIEEILQILDSEYGANRNKYEDDGGYVVVVEKIEDFKEIMDKAYIDCNEVIAEYVDKIVCSNGEVDIRLQVLMWGIIDNLNEKGKVGLNVLME